MKKIIIIGLLISICLFCSYNNYSYKKRQEKLLNEEVTTYISKTDKDNDGIDDQSDILQNAKAYVATKPSYKSKYYESGYPDDNYGVCTDVIGYALKNSGYDLMELVYEDVINNRDAYDIDTPDKNIDFRRVPNLNVYFKRNAISLDTNIYNIKEWQGGDIVVFTNHIAIVSDKRNDKGIPYIIHHSGPFQLFYEEDKLESKEGHIIGHYRIS